MSALDGFDVILASKSPRRSELLRAAGVTFSVQSCDTTESLDDSCRSDARQAAKIVAHRKASAVAESLEQSRTLMRPTLVIGADTMVVLDGEIFGKPIDDADAFRMLRALSGRTHEVITGVSLVYLDGQCAKDAEDSPHSVQFAEVSRVTFRSLTDDEIWDYIKTGECSDKAGAYAVQGIGARLVEGVEGSVDNVIGLPVVKLFEAASSTSKQNFVHSRSF